MSNIFDYLSWRGDLSFNQSKFNEVDSIILSKLSYIPFEHLSFSLKDNFATIKDIAEDLLNNDKAKTYLWPDDITLLNHLKNSHRFNNLKLFNYSNITDFKSQIQFSAITIKIKKDLSFIAFRGTDDTLVGWKEDLNMSFVTPVPSQIMAVKYFNNLAESLTDKFILGGHSKGGNLAIYAGAFCKKEYQKRIQKIYNFDGPGFTNSILEKNEYKSICHKIKTYVPQSSVIGILLGHEEKYTIVHSNQKNGILQHDICSWEINCTKFVYLKNVTNKSKFVNFTIKEWLCTTDIKNREKFINSIYEILLKTKSKTLGELNENWLKTATIVLLSINSLDKETKKAVQETLFSLMKSTKKWLQIKKLSNEKNKNSHV